MEKKNKKTLILLIVLLIIFIFTLTRALKVSKPKTITVSQNNIGQEIQQEKIASKNNEDLFDFQEIDASLSKLQSIVKNIDEQSSQTSIEIRKNPFKQTSEKIINSGSILRQDYVSEPDFKISGILYDKEKPMVIIDNEVKSENETKSGYSIYKIFSDRVILKKQDREFILYVSSDKISDAINMPEENLVETKFSTNETTLYQPIVTNIDKPEKNSSIPKTVVEPTIVKYETKEKSTIDFSESEIKKIITVQIASFGENRKKQAIEFAKRLVSDGYKNVRVEKINDLYTVRIGTAQDKEELISLCENLKKYSETSFIRTGFLIKERIVYPPIENLSFNM